MELGEAVRRGPGPARRVRSSGAAAAQRAAREVLLACLVAATPGACGTDVPDEGRFATADAPAPKGGDGASLDGASLDGALLDATDTAHLDAAMDGGGGGHDSGQAQPDAIPDAKADAILDAVDVAIDAGVDAKAGVDGGEDAADGGGAGAADAGEEAGAGGDAGPIGGPLGMWAVAIAAGDTHTCVVHGNGKGSCWGGNGRRQCGTGSKASEITKPTLIANLKGLTAITTHLNHTCSRDAKGAIACWGDNFFGAVGMGSKSPYVSTPWPLTAPDQVQRVAPGGRYTLALRTNGEVWGWGQNIAYQLADGTPSSSNVPKLAGTVLGKAGLVGISHISAGGYHACAVRAADGKVLCWGRGWQGQVGNGKSGGGNTVKIPTVLAKVPQVVKVATGEFHTCAVTKKGQLWCWGRNTSGECGTGDTKGPVLQPVWVSQVMAVGDVALGIAHTCAVMTGGQVRCWGRNNYGQLGGGPAVGDGSVPGGVAVKLPAEVIALDAGTEHTCAVLKGGEVYCWGRNQKHQLGDGSDVDRDAPVLVVGSKP